MKLNINAKQWNALNEGDRNKIQSIISGCFKGTTITPDSNTPKIAEACNLTKKLLVELLEREHRVAKKIEVST